jgi:hypothetical protein
LAASVGEAAERPVAIVIERPRPVAKKRQGAQTRSLTRGTYGAEENEQPTGEKETEEKEAGGSITVLHGLRSLQRGLAQKQAYAAAERDILEGVKVFDRLEENIQQAVHRLASVIVTQGKTVATVQIGSYFVGVAQITTENEKRSEETGYPLGRGKATFRMVGRIVGEEFVEVAGTSYANVQPTGAYGWSTLTQSSHALPSFLLSPEGRSLANTTIEKTSFVNQSYDRGSENAIRKLASDIDNPVLAVVELLG